MPTPGRSSRPNAGGVGRHWPTAVPPVNGRVARAEPIGRAPGEHGLRDLGSPGDAALDPRRARAPSSARSVGCRSQSSLSAASEAA